MDDIRGYNLEVWRDTVKMVHNNKVPSPEPSYKFSTDILDYELEEDDLYETEVKVVNADTLDVARGLVVSGYNPLILNMANHETPGGGVIRGACAQEEDIFRRTNYFKTITKQLYPILDNELIYSPKVHVFKDSGYNPCNTWTGSFVAVAALRRGPMDEDVYIDVERESMRQKIEMIFHLAAAQEHDSLVLGAFGCGAFHNPPEEVRELFEDVMLSDQYRGRFKKIVFAVLSNDECVNYDTFKLIERINDTFL